MCAIVFQMRKVLNSRFDFSSVLGVGERKHIFLLLTSRSTLLKITMNTTINSTDTENSSDGKSNLKHFAWLIKGFERKHRIIRLSRKHFFSLFNYRLLIFTVFTRLIWQLLPFNSTLVAVNGCEYMKFIYLNCG